MIVRSHRVAGIASFLAWLPVTVTGLLISFSILVFVGVPTLFIGSTLLVSSVRAARGSRPAVVVVVIGALSILGWVLIPVLFVADSTPDGALGWACWGAELLLAVTTIAAGAAALASAISETVASDARPRRATS